MTSQLDRLTSAMDDAGDAWKQYAPYMLFEGYDVKPRDEAILHLALADGVDLNAPYFVRHVPLAPHKFQNGYLLSRKFFRKMIASSQNGKSLVAFMEIQMRLSGVIPFAYRYPEGHDTGVPRIITPENVRRWGRRSKDTGEILDRDERAAVDGKWDCGNVTGRGIFPSSKLVQNGGTIRLGSYQKIILANWWPAFTGRAKDSLGRFFLPTAIDNERGSFSLGGANKQDMQIFYKGDKTLQLLTYESGAEKFETITPPTYLDEEPPRNDIIGAVVTHCTDWSLLETPIFGITYTKALIFPDDVVDSQEVFHATTYDCPYHTDDMIEKQRETLNSTPWEIGARLWGVPSELAGKPYYDRVKIGLWIQRFKDTVPYDLVTFEPTAEWDGIKTNERMSRFPGLLDTPVRMVLADKEDKRAVWRLYEDRKDGVGYISASDQADGAEIAEDVGDWSVACMGRQRDPVTDPTKPVVCATLRSSLPTPQFAREVLYAARYFNNAMLAPESAKGYANATFAAVCDDWPWWFKDTVEKWSTRKPKENRGFCPTQDRRETVFDKLIRDWLDSFDENTYPEIPDEHILRELAAAIVGSTMRKTATRCDHPRNGTLDSAMAYGILHFVMQEGFVRQIKCNGGKEAARKKLTWLEMAEAAMKPKGPPIGLGAIVKKLR